MVSKVKKTDLAYKVAEEFNITKRLATNIIDYIFDEITNTIVKGEEVSLVGFGTFYAKERVATKCVNPRNLNEQIDVPSMCIPKFKAGKPLKDALKNNFSEDEE